MTPLLVLTYAGALGAVALAWAVSSQAPAHRPIAGLLTFGLAADVVRQGIQWGVLAAAYAALQGAPATGWVRAAAHVDQALFLAYPAALAAVASWIYIGRRPWPVALGYTLAEVGFVVSYPAIRGDAIRKAYLGFQLACLTVAVGAFVQWAAFRKNPPTVGHWIIALMAGVEMANITAGPWRLGFFMKWELAQLAYCMLYAMLILVQWGWLWANKNSSSRS